MIRNSNKYREEQKILRTQSDNCEIRVIKGESYGELDRKYRLEMGWSLFAGGAFEIMFC